MKKIIIGIVAFLMLATPAFAATKIAYVNLQKVLHESKAGVAARAELDKIGTGLETELKIKQGEFLKFQEDVKKQVGVLSKGALQKKEQELQQKYLELRNLDQQAKVTLQKEERKRTTPILNELKVVLKKMGKSGDYSLILEYTEGGLLYNGDDVVDLTEKLIKKYDATK